MEIKCIAIDDEPLALDVIKSHVSKLSYLNLEASYNSPIEAIPQLKILKPDLIFLDIQMPELSGLEFAKLIGEQTHIIFTTAYEDYAIQSYDLCATDYLLKPIAFDRFVKAINKVIARSHYYDDIILKDTSVGDNKFAFIDTSIGQIKVKLSEILYIKGLKDYVEIVLKDRNIVTRQSMQCLEKQLSPRGFVRIHRSFIVQLNNIESVMGNIVKIKEEMIPIGKTYKDIFVKALNNFKL